MGILMKRRRVMIIEARFYTHIADMLLQGARAVLEEQEVRIDITTVPGILEIPAALEMVDTTKSYDGYVLLGTAIRGESDHYDHICQACINGCSEVAIRRHLAVGNGILTVHNEGQALKRADASQKNVGGLAARACISMVELKTTLKMA